MASGAPREFLVPIVATDTAYTPLCSLLYIDVPIVQAPIGGGASPALAAAVSNAGELGMLAGTWKEPEELRQAICETASLTNRPFGVNFVLEWEQRDRLTVCLEEGVAGISFSWGDPAAYHDAVHAGGALMMHTVGSAAEARRSVVAGTDIIVAQGWEAGGHVWGGVSTLVLVPCVVDAVTPVPVVAAGRPSSGQRPREGETVAFSHDGRSIPRNHVTHPQAGMRGDLEALALYAGQSCGLVSRVEPARVLVERLVNEAAQALDACAHIVQLRETPDDLHVWES